MEVTRMVILGLLSLGLLVVVHEFGHFWVARRFGVAVLRFSVGFGKPFFTWVDRSGTEFALAPIPLGGYVHMHGESPVSDEEPPAHLGEDAEARSFANKPVWQRSLIVAAGPAINLLLAVLLFWALFMLGENGARPIVAHVTADSPAERAGFEVGMEIVGLDGEAIEFKQDFWAQMLRGYGADGAPLRFEVLDSGFRREVVLQPARSDWLSGREGVGMDVVLRDDFGFGLRPLYPLRLAQVAADGAAAAAGLRVGDVVLAIDGRHVADWQELVGVVRAAPGKDLRFSIERDGRRLNIVARPEPIVEGGQRYGRLGVVSSGIEADAQVRRQRRHAPTAALGQALQRSWEMTTLTFNAIAQMITGVLSPKQLSGPITIVRLTGKAAEMDWRIWVSLLALISLNLGLLNLLPIPLLDGGHLLYLGAEGVRGRPLSLRVRVIGQLLGIAIVTGVMLMAIYNDILLLLQR